MDLLRTFLREQAALVLAGQGTTPDQVHDTRVAIRRLRSAIRVFGLGADDLDAELGWYAGLLGAIRDRQVQRERFHSAHLDTGFLEQWLYDDQIRGESTLREVLGSERFQALRARLEEWADQPPVDRLSKVALKDRGDAAGRKALRRLEHARSDEELHRARKSVKRARYAAEMLHRRGRAKRFKAIQDVLGDLQDTVVARETLARFSEGATPEQAFALGQLAGRELVEHDRLRREARALA